MSIRFSKDKESVSVKLSTETYAWLQKSISTTAIHFLHKKEFTLVHRISELEKLRAVAVEAGGEARVRHIDAILFQLRLESERGNTH